MINTIVCYSFVSLLIVNLMKHALRTLFAHCLLVLLICAGSSVAQAQLKPSIGLSSLPADRDSICPMVFNIDTAYCYEMTGLHNGDTIPEFVLYTAKNERVDIAEVLKSGKPLLLIGGSYTCPIFRQKREKINQLQAIYGDRINIFVVYTEEAHPKGPQVSPYSGNVWTLDANIKKNILYSQPGTYGDRKQAAKEMLASRELDVPVLLDGPCNPWWTTFGVAPNSAFLIGANGILVHKQGWLNGGNAPMSFYIDSLLKNSNESVNNPLQNKATLDQSAGSVIKFSMDKEVANATVSIYDRYGRNPYPVVSFSGKEYVMDASLLSTGKFLYEIRNGEEAATGQFLISKQKDQAELSGSKCGSNLSDKNKISTR